MSRTIQIQNSNEVMAQFGTPGVFYRGLWQNIQVTGITDDNDIPLEVRAALVGLELPTIFTKESIEAQTGTNLPITANTRLAYCADIIDILNAAGKTAEASALAKIATNPLDMYTIAPEYYQLR